MSSHSQPRSCEICGSDRKTHLFRQQFEGGLPGALLDGYDVVVCACCGFGFADGIPPQEAIDEYYGSMSKYEPEHQGGEQSDFHRRRFAVAAEFIRSTVAERQAAVLDLGCASGGLLGALQALGYTDLMGIDPSPQCVRAVRGLVSVRAAEGSLFRLPSGIGPFDVVLLSAVLEHVRDLRRAVRQVADLLTPGGYLYLEVPDVTRFGSTPDAPFQEFSVEHINYFTLPSLVNLMGAEGFRLVDQRQTSTLIGVVASHELRAIFRWERGAPSGCCPEPETEAALRRYIVRSQAIEQGIHEAIRPWVSSQQGILVWGVGTHTQRLLATSDLPKARIVAFVDSNPRYQGRTFHGSRVLAPSELAHRPEPILISSRFFQEEIARQIRSELKLENELIRLYAD